MTQFIPGQPVVSFQTKSGQEAIVRYPKWEDLPHLLRFINELSAEDTYVSLSGEELTLEQEADFLLNWYKRMELGDGVYLVCELGEQILGTCGIERTEADRARGEHVAEFGLSVSKVARGQGIGETIARATLEEARQHMPKLRLVLLRAFGVNTPAISLYQKLGFQTAGEIPGAVLYKGEYLSRVQMFLPIE